MSVYDVRTKINSEGKPVSVGYPYPSDRYKVRNLIDKEFWWEPKGDSSKEGLFGRNRFTAGSHKYVVVTEGELDALSMYEVLQVPAVSVHSATSAVRDCTVDRSFLNSFERIYVAFDGDAAGREATEAVAKLFDYNKVYVVRFTRPDRKDPNEYVRNGETTELRNLWWNSKRYLPDVIKSSLEDFRIALAVPPKLGVPYPFPTLTDMTYGIRKGETVILTAQEKVGKTAIMHAIEHHLLKETDDAVGSIFLEENADRHLQALAGIELGKPAHLPDSGCTTGDIISAVEKVVRRDDRLHLFNHFGSDDPGLFLDTIRFLVTARACSYILLDHITMVVSGLQGEDERRKLDYFSTRLEMMVKELYFALIMVSHVNDEGKTRGSRYITKVSDITINATRDALSLDPVERNTIRLTIPYNRFCSCTGPAGNIVLDPNTYLLREVANDNQAGAPNGLHSLQSAA